VISHSQDNRIGGFPHSEIVGSKLAHSSPTLIAACHVLHRLCMPRHPPNALTSRLRVRTTNDSAERRRDPKIEQVQHKSGDAAELSQHRLIDQAPSAPRSKPCCTDAVTASISRTHSQCQRRGRTPLPAKAGSVVFISGEDRHQPRGVVEPVGIEPTTSSLQS
jgi:hypothetical protein